MWSSISRQRKNTSYICKSVESVEKEWDTTPSPKYFFIQPRLVLLGNFVCADVAHIDGVNVDKILNAIPLRDRKGLSSFLGLA